MRKPTTSRSELAAPAPQRIAVAMSGGADSNAAAAWLVDQGHAVVGLTARMWREGSRCCAAEDIEQARRVAAFLGIPHYVVDALDVFTSAVVEPFLSAYANGRTPSPCVLCNAEVKFGFLATRARQLQCAALATGHYARRELRPDGWHLLKAFDRGKDQSYFLHRLSQRQLAYACFPLADRKKTDLLAYNRARGLPPATRPESQDLCFVPQRGLPAFIELQRPELRRRGAIEDVAGRVLGHHNGLHYFTVGQRKGLGIARGQPLYVIALDSARNAVIVGTEAQARTERFRILDAHWIANRPPDPAKSYGVRVRFRAAETPARLRLAGADTAEVILTVPLPGVAPGQAAVVYAGDEILGGGWIAPLNNDTNRS